MIQPSHNFANATYEVSGNSRFLGKPYEPNGVIKNDIEYILMLRKPGGYRKFSEGETWSSNGVKSTA